MTLAEILPEEDYRFQMRFKKGTVREFYGPSPRNSEILAERQRCLATDSQQYAALLPEGSAVLRETIDLARAEQTLPEENSPLSGTGLEPFDLCVALGLV